MDAQKFKYDSVEIAKYIVAYGNESGYVMNMTKTQKLLYITYGIYLAVKNKRLFDEHPQAWPFGPVFPRTRNKLLKCNLEEININNEEFREIRKDEEIVSLIKLVFDTFGNWSASRLTAWSHQSNSPWDRTIAGDDYKWGERISDTSIQDYFNSIVSISNND